MRTVRPMLIRIFYLMFVMFGRRQVRPPSGSAAVRFGRPSGSAVRRFGRRQVRPPSGSGRRQVRPHSGSAAVRFGRRHVPPHPVGPHQVRPAVRLGRRQVRPHPVGPHHVRPAVRFGMNAVFLRSQIYSIKMTQFQKTVYSTTYKSPKKKPYFSIP
jgi:hypothetical protein